jgi:hypothetical protein
MTEMYCTNTATLALACGMARRQPPQCLLEDALDDALWQAGVMLAQE